MSLKSKIFAIVFPLLVTAVSIYGVSRLRRQEGTLIPPVATDESNQPAEANPPAPAYAPASSVPPVTIPADTKLAVRLDAPLGASRAVPGEAFSGTLANPVVVSGQTVIPAGAPVKGKVVYAREAGRLKGVAVIRLALTSVDIQGNDYRVDTTTFTRTGRNHNKRNGEMIGGGAGIGALFGALIGRGKGALIGAGAGAGAGTAGAAFTAHRDLVLPAETAMTFRLLRPVEVNL